MNGLYTALACHLGTCTWPGRPTCHVHDGPCTRPCTRPVYTNIYRAVYGPCTWLVYTAVYWPCIWRVHGLVTAVYTYACVHGRERTGRVLGRARAVSDRVDGRVRAVYRDVGRVHGSCAVCYYDFLCKRHLLCRNVATNPLHSKRARTTSAPSVALRRTTVLRTMLIIG